MIEALKSDDLIRKMGGRFKLAALIEKRWLELMQGERPMVDPEGLTDLEVVVEEIKQGKIDIDFEKTDIAFPDRDEE
jgi:DNA-directed RNA polymerase subunit omega